MIDRFDTIGGINTGWLVTAVVDFVVFRAKKYRSHTEIILMGLGDVYTPGANAVRRHCRARKIRDTEW